MSHAETIVPQNVQDFARELTALASKYDLRKISVTVSFGYGSQEWDEPINIAWESGRHGEDARRYSISTTLRIHGRVEIGAPRP